MLQLQLLDRFVYHQISTPCLFIPQLKVLCDDLQSKLISDSLHIKSQSKGFELQYKLTHQKKCPPECKSEYCRFQLETIFLYLNHKKFNKYNYSLVYTLVPNSTLKSVTMLLGEPQTKSKYLIECIWEKLGIGITFLGNNWKNQDLLIQYLYLYEPKPDSQQKILCSLCKKDIQKKQQIINCENCEIIHYCSKQCFEKHNKYHQIYCQTVD